MSECVCVFQAQTIQPSTSPSRLSPVTTAKRRSAAQQSLQHTRTMDRQPNMAAVDSDPVQPASGSTPVKRCSSYTSAGIVGSSAMTPASHRNSAIASALVVGNTRSLGRKMSSTGNARPSVAAASALLTGTVSMVSLQANGSPSMASAALLGSGAGAADSAVNLLLRPERPYNSLKKKRNSERELWRQSWGSAHSQSSCSIHSNATTAGALAAQQIGKDDFWAALQTNYNYIMDTNLLDTCKEARCELLNGSDAVDAAGLDAADPDDEDSCDDCAKIKHELSLTGRANRAANAGAGASAAPNINDPRRLRRWLRKMEMDIARAPTLHQARRMKIGELRRRLREYSDLYRLIVSQTGEVRACIRTAEAAATTTAEQPQPDNETTTTTSSPAAVSTSTANGDRPVVGEATAASGTDADAGSAASVVADNVSPARKADTAGNLKALETRFHMLYLQAIEVQCLLEGQLARKEHEAAEHGPDESSSSASQIPSDDTDDEPAAKFPRLAEQRSANAPQPPPQQPLTATSRYSNSEWLPFELLIPAAKQQHRNHADASNNGFDADSEGSDNDHGQPSHNAADVDLSPNLTTTPTDAADKRHQQPRTATPATAKPSNPIQFTTTIGTHMRSPSNGNGHHSDNGSAMGIAAETTTPTPTLALEADAPADCNGNPIRSAQRSPANSSTAAVRQPTTSDAKSCKTTGHHNNNHQTSKATKRSRLPDASKFNRSNRKSKNCATFYFKHSDTDGESQQQQQSRLLGNSNAPVVGPWSTSQASDSLRGTSEDDDFDDGDDDEAELDDEWVYQNDDNDGHPTTGRDKNRNMAGGNRQTSSSETGAGSCSDAAATTTHSSVRPQKPQHRTPADVSSALMTSSTTSTVIDMAMRKDQHGAAAAAHRQQHHQHASETKAKTYNKESIQQLVMDAESLVRDEHLIHERARHLRRRSIADGSSGGILATANAGSKTATLAEQQALPKIKRVHEWLMHQPPNGDGCVDNGLNPNDDAVPPITSTDCEASAENTESDSADRDSDSSEMLSDSVATCLLENGAPSQFTSNEIIASLAEMLSVKEHHASIPNGCSTNVAGPPKVAMRTKRRNSERPWSVSCLSQLRQTEDAQERARHVQAAANQGLANHSISESALHMWSGMPAAIAANGSAAVVGASTNGVGGRGATSAATSATTVHQSYASMRSGESKNSLKRRKMRAKKKTMGRRSESGSNGSDQNTGNSVQELSRILTSTLSKSETFAGRTDLVEDLSEALSMVAAGAEHVPPRRSSGSSAGSGKSAGAPIDLDESEEDIGQRMQKPIFRLGKYTSAYGGGTASAAVAGASRLGSLAALANYNTDREVRDHSYTGTDNSNEQAWDPYQDRYNSEAYSEGMDSDAARRLLEFGDDYRNFIDSQSDCCSSLSAANHPDSSLSPLATRRNNRPSIGGSGAGMYSMRQPGSGGASMYGGGGWTNSSKSASKSPPAGGAFDESTTVVRRGHARRPGDYEQLERRRRSSESSRKMQLNEFCMSMGFDRLSTSSGRSSQPADSPTKGDCPPGSAIGINASASRSQRGSRLHHQHHSTANANGSSSNASSISRKLEMEFISKLDKQRHDAVDATNVAAVSTGGRRRLRSERTLMNLVAGGSAAAGPTGDRRSSSTSCSSSAASGSSSADEAGATAAGAPNATDDEAAERELLAQCRQRCEHTKALRIRSHLLRPEDYAEIISTCRDNIKCLETVLRSKSRALLSAGRSQAALDILSSWEGLLDWSENAAVARQLQDEMATLKTVLRKLGQSTNASTGSVDGSTAEGPNRCDSEASIQLCIDELRTERTTLQTHRKAMLNLNASVHSWLTRQEMKAARSAINDAPQTPPQSPASAAVSSASRIDSSTCTAADAADAGGQQRLFDNNEAQLHAKLKDEVGEMYSVWDEADARIGQRLDDLTASLIAWKQFESGLNEFKEALGKDEGALRGLNGILDASIVATGAAAAVNGASAALTGENRRPEIAAGSAHEAAAAHSQSNETKLAQDVKAVAKRLSEHLDSKQQRQKAAAEVAAVESETPVQQIAGSDQHYLNSLLTAIPFGLSNGSLSDSGISDGSSDYGLSERERRLSALRRLARQLENALAPGSAALHSISARMEAAEADLRALQDTCRQLIVRTAAASQMHRKQDADEQQSASRPTETAAAEGPAESELALAGDEADGCPSDSSAREIARKTSPKSTAAKQRRSTAQLSQSNKTRNRRSETAASNGHPDATPNIRTTSDLERQQLSRRSRNSSGGGGGDPDSNGSTSTAAADDPASDRRSDRGQWARRAAKFVVPIQMALVALICAVACLEPHCCDTLNNHYMSFTPQLRYVRGPPPI